jgi:hypothetical protein
MLLLRHRANADGVPEADHPNAFGLRNTCINAMQKQQNKSKKQSSAMFLCLNLLTVNLDAHGIPIRHQ